jgi:hypothetical protein
MFGVHHQGTIIAMRMSSLRRVMPRLQLGTGTIGQDLAIIVSGSTEGVIGRQNIAAIVTTTTITMIDEGFVTSQPPP